MKIGELIEELRTYSQYDEEIYLNKKGTEFVIESVGDEEDTWLEIKEK